MSTNQDNKAKYKVIENEEEQKIGDAPKVDQTINIQEDLGEFNYSIHHSRDKLNEFVIEEEKSLFKALFEIFSLERLNNIFSRILTALDNLFNGESKILAKFLSKFKFRHLLLRLQFLKMIQELLKLFVFQALIQKLLSIQNSSVQIQEIKQIEENNFKLSLVNENKKLKQIDFTFSSAEFGNFYNSKNVGSSASLQTNTITFNNVNIDHALDSSKGIRPYIIPYLPKHLGIDQANELYLLYLSKPIMEAKGANKNPYEQIMLMNAIRNVVMYAYEKTKDILNYYNSTTEIKTKNAQSDFKMSNVKGDDEIIRITIVRK